MRSARAFGVCIIFLSTLAMAQSASIPTIEQPLVPSAAQPGGAGFTLTINGAGFTPAPTDLLWGVGTNVTQLKIASSTSTQLTVAVPSSLITTAGTSSVSLLNVSGNPSNVEFFQIATPASPQFAPAVDYGVGASGTVAIQFTLAADLNGDGILDLAVGVSNPASGSAVAVLLGNSDGTFQNATSYPVDDATSIVAGRFTNDGGSIDLVAGETLLTNNGTGTFTTTSLGVEGFRPFAVGDFNQTGALDLAGAVGVNVQILNNNGEGGFTAGQSFTGNTTQFGGMLAADFNGDGILDLAVLDVYPQLPVVRVFLGSTEGFSAGNPLTTDTPPGGVAFTAADFNGDNKQDIAFVYNPPAGGGAVLFLKGNGDGSFTSGTPQPLANPVTGAIVTADFNEDGKLDLATGTYILPGNGDGTFATPINFGGTGEVLATGDFNGDGRPDLVTQGPSEVAVLLQSQPGAPIVTLMPTSLNFTTQLTGTTSTGPAVTLTNSGNALLTINSIGFTGTNASEFAQTNTCPIPPYNTLEAGSSCTITVTFTPTAAGNATASLSIADSAAGSPQTVSITGTAQSILTTSCTSLTVVPGQTAIFTVDLAPVGDFTPSVSLSCSGAPALSTCTVSPNLVTVNGSSTAKVTATTTAATGSLRSPFEHSNGNRMAGLAALAGIAGLAALVVLPGKRGAKRPRRICGLVFLLFMLATLAMLPSCGGGGGDPPGTAAGTYPLTVTGTFQSATGAPITETVSFNLVVQ